MQMIDTNDRFLAVKILLKKKNNYKIYIAIFILIKSNLYKNE